VMACSQCNVGHHVNHKIKSRVAISDCLRKGLLLVLDMDQDAINFSEKVCMIYKTSGSCRGPAERALQSSWLQPLPRLVEELLYCLLWLFYY